MAEKSSRKDLRQPDEFITFTQRALDWIVTNKMMLIAGGTLVIAIVLAFFGWRWYVESATQKASAAFVQARQIMQARVVPQEGAEETSLADGTYASEDDKLRAALASLESVKKEFSSSATATLATYFIGECHWKLGEYDKAVAAFEEYLRSAGPSGELSAFAVEGIGATLEDQGKFEEAKQQYRRLTEEPFVSQRARGQYHLARMEQKLGNAEQAATMFKELMRDFPDTAYARDIQERLSQLPTVADPAVAPEAEPAGGDTPTKPAQKPATDG